MVVVATPAILVSAKTVQVSLPLLLVVALLSAILRGRGPVWIPPVNYATVSLFALLSYALLSASWAREPHASAQIALLGAFIAWGSITVMQILHSEGRADTLHITEGLWIGFLIGVVYALAEVLSDQAIKIWVYNALGLGPAELEPDRYFTWDAGALIKVHPDDLKRNLIPIPLLLWPALVAARAISSRVWRIATMAVLLGLSFAAVVIGPSQTGKIALFTGFGALLFAIWLPRATHWGLAIAWLVACLGAVPLALWGRELELQNADWLQLSGQLRILIWNEIAQLVPNAPIFGVGANMTYFIQPPLHEAPLAGPEWMAFPIPHPHNVYLQAWYELGVVGVVLLTGFGIAVLREIARVSEVSARPYLYAVFAAAAVQIGTSYNMWQIWFMCLFGFLASMCAIAVNLSKS